MAHSDGPCPAWREVGPAPSHPHRRVLDVWPVSLLSDMQQLPPSARHGQQEDPSPPEGVHLSGKTGPPGHNCRPCVCPGPRAGAPLFSRLIV